MFEFLKYDSPFYRLMQKVLDLVYLNLLFVFTALPIVTLGTSVSALYCSLFKMNEENHDNILENYITFFKSNWKQTTVMHLVLTAVLSVIFINLVVLRELGHQYQFVILILNLLILFAILLFISMVYPYLSKFNGSMKVTTIIVFKIILDNILKSIMLMVLSFLPVWIMIILPPTLPIILFSHLLVGFSLAGFINVKILNKIFNKYIDNEEDVKGSEKVT